MSDIERNNKNYKKKIRNDMYNDINSKNIEQDYERLMKEAMKNNNNKYGVSSRGINGGYKNSSRPLNNGDIKIYHCHPELRKANSVIRGTELSVTNIPGRTHQMHIFNHDIQGLLTITYELTTSFDVKKYVENINTNKYGKQDILVVEMGDRRESSGGMIIAISEYEIENFSFDFDYGEIGVTTFKLDICFNEYTMI